MGDVIQNNTSPDFRFREVGISDSMVAILKISASVCINNNHPALGDYSNICHNSQPIRMHEHISIIT